MDFFVPMRRIVGKARPRFMRSGHTYTTESTRDAEKQIAACARSAGVEPIQAPQPVSVLIEAFYPIPTSWPKAKKADANAGDLLPTVKPDIDNVAKLVLDALNGIAYEDDAQVVAIAATKAYGLRKGPDGESDRPIGLRITVCEMGDDE